MSQQYTVLSREDRDHFLEHGYVVVHDCFTREAAEALTDRAFIRLGYDKNDPGTWEKPRIHMPTLEGFTAHEFAPKAWRAICELLGGEERVKSPCWWGDAFIANLGEGADVPWQPPSAATRGWHKDGDFFRHFLDSPEQGLLTLVIWSDIEHKGGGTFIAPDSVGIVAKVLAEHPEGLRPNEFDFKGIMAQCRRFHEFTGKIGDVVLLHPYMMHAVSQNHLGKARFITNPPAMLKEPMNFNRENPEDFSLVELAVLRALGVGRLDFRPTGEREQIEPERRRLQRIALEEEKKRVEAAAA